MKVNMRAGLAVLLLLLLAGSSAAQTMPAACKGTFKGTKGGAALMAAMGGLKKACPPGAKTCSAACKAAFKKAPLNCWKAAMAPLGAATVNSVTAGWKTCKL